MPQQENGQAATISIHALLAESDLAACDGLADAVFLSTLSLRRATVRVTVHTCRDAFLSTLSLRRATIFAARQAAIRVFLSTLSLRRATIGRV